MPSPYISPEPPEAIFFGAAFFGAPLRAGGEDFFGDAATARLFDFEAVRAELFDADADLRAPDLRAEGRLRDDADEGFFAEEDFFGEEDFVAEDRFRAGPRDFAAAFRPDRFAPPELFDLPFLAAPPAAFFFFLTTGCSSSPGPRRSPDHTIPILSNRDGDRVLITPLPAGVRIEVRPLVRSRRERRRLILVAAVLVAAAFFAGARLAAAWESGLRRGAFADIPLPLLIVLSAAVGLSTPLVLLGLAALAFAEETVEVGPTEVVVRTSAFERATELRIGLADLECWRETLLPLPPWWTWAVARLAAKASGRLHPLAGMAGPREKRRIGAALAKATGKPFLDDFGRDRGESRPPRGG